MRPRPEQALGEIMPLRLYNTLTRRKEDFAPIDPARVRLYACGPTVYDHLHIGNGRMLIVFDVLFRLLRHEFGAEHVTYVRNITDVDDKINARAAERGVDIRVLTDEMTAIFHEDARALGCLPPTVEPRATDHIAQMIGMIEKLIANGHAYVAEDHVLFDVPSMPTYGKLSKRPLDEMIAGARVEVAPYKRGPMDFVLWKPSTPGSGPGAGWDSPWGRGRPGWHIECSAMSAEYLGETFDIHGGGIDLVFPHHENEIAQSCCAFDRDVMANVWMHNGHLQVEGEKMSKSLGNFVTIRELLRGWRGEPWTGSTLRFAMLGTHYRQPIDWTVERLSDAKKQIWKLVNYTSPQHFADPHMYHQAWEAESHPSGELASALSDDLNTVEAISNLKVAISRADSLDDQRRVALVHDARFLGVVTAEQRRWLFSSPVFLQMPVTLPKDTDIHSRDFCVFSANKDADKISEERDWFENHEFSIVDDSYCLTIQYTGKDPTPGKIDRMKEERRAAREAKDWTTSDRIRDEFAKMGITVQDNPDGTMTLHCNLVGETGRFELKGSAATLEVKR
jgi:cysteinyl-tRNA synthetase